MIGLFIMDVSNSTSHNNSSEISGYLEQLESQIKLWTAPLDRSYVNFRMGDELFFVTTSPSSMLILSYYIKLLWPFKNQPIKFGMAIGEAEFPDGDLEHWNAPLIKSARLALDDIKANELVDFKLIQTQDERLYNDVLFYYLTEIIATQTAIQKDIFILNLVSDSQKTLAEKMTRSVSTISTHLKKGHAKQLSLIEAVLLQHDENDAIQMKQLILNAISQEAIRWK